MKALIVATLVLAVRDASAAASKVHVWEKVELTLQAWQTYTNPYTAVQVWVDLKGPHFVKRCYGFWDGGNVFRVRVLATVPGKWSWRSGSNQNDSGLNGHKGDFDAVAWSEAEKAANETRRGFIRPNGN